MISDPHPSHGPVSAAAHQGRQAAVDTSESPFRDLFEHGRGLICTHDMKGVFLSINPAAAAALGFAADELTGRPMIDLVVPAQRAHFRAYLARIADAGEDAGLLYLRHRSGERRIWEYRNRVHHDARYPSFVMGYAQDITQRHLAEQRVREQQMELEVVSDECPAGLFRTDLAGEFVYVNRSFERISGLRTDEARGMGWGQALHPDDRNNVLDTWFGAIRTVTRFQTTCRLRHEGGRTVWVSIAAVPLIVQGEIAGFAGSVEDVTARQIAESQLRRSESRLRTIADAIPAKIGYIDRAERFVFANAAYGNAYGIAHTDMVGRSLCEILGDTTYARRKPYLTRAMEGERTTFEDEERCGGGYSCMEVTYLPQFDEDDTTVQGLHMMVQDITSNKLRERHLIQQAAEADDLTGLVNRAGFLARLEQALARSRDQHSMLGVMYLDIDHFKHINDRYGHGSGDRVLKAFADRLSSVLRTSDVAGRLGGDEFAVITEGVRRPLYAAAVAAKIVAAVRRPFVFKDIKLSLSITTSLGMALTVDEAGISGAELLHVADGALYAAKAAGRNAYRMTIVGKHAMPANLV